MNHWIITCTICGKVFTSDVKGRAENDLVMHYQDQHRGKYIDISGVEAQQQS